MIRNAGGVVTDDEIRSLAISQRLLGTEEIILIHDTDCGMPTFTDDEFKKTIQDETGIKPEWAPQSFNDLDIDVRQSIAQSRPRPSSRTGTPSAASSTRSRRDACARSHRDAPLRHGPTRNAGRGSPELLGGCGPRRSMVAEPDNRGAQQDTHSYGGPRE
jgi:hypothetical protein